MENKCCVCGENRNKPLTDEMRERHHAELSRTGKSLLSIHPKGN